MVSAVCIWKRTIREESEEEVHPVAGSPTGSVGRVGGCHVLPELILLVQGVMSVMVGAETTAFSIGSND